MKFESIHDLKMMEKNEYEIEKLYFFECFFRFVAVIEAHFSMNKYHLTFYMNAWHISYMNSKCSDVFQYFF